MTEEKSLSERMADLENKIDYLVYQKKPQCEPGLSENQFMAFYSRVEKEIENVGASFGIITMNSRFENILKHKVLYPDYERGVWYPIGKSSKDIPVDFRNMGYDFAVEMLDAGNFPSTPDGVGGIR